MHILEEILHIKVLSVRNICNSQFIIKGFCKKKKGTLGIDANRQV